MGREEEARNILRELSEVGRRRYVSQVYVAAILANLGERDQALTCLEKTFDDRCTWLAYIRVDPRLDRLRGEARFQNLLRRSLLCVTDAVILPLHLEYPETIGVTDHRPREMVATRLRLMDKAAKAKSLVSTSHFAFPGLGRVAAKGKSWDWQPIPVTSNSQSWPTSLRSIGRSVRRFT